MTERGEREERRTHPESEGRVRAARKTPAGALVLARERSAKGPAGKSGRMDENARLLWREEGRGNIRFVRSAGRYV